MQIACRTSDLAIWNASLRQVCGAFDATPMMVDTPFIGEIVYRELADTALTLIRTNARSLIGQPGEEYGAAAAPSYLVLQLQGECLIRQHGETVALAKGELALLDTDARCEINPRGLITHVSVHLPQATLRERLAADGHLFRKISVRTLSGRMLRDLLEHVCQDYLEEFCGVGGQTTPLNATILSLLVSAWRESSAHRFDLKQTGDDDNLWLRTLRLIEDNLMDPDLGPQMISRQLGISLRQLHRQFEKSGTSPARYIQQARMTHIARHLIDPSYADKSITDVALHWGFCDSAHFSHAFKKAYGMSPSSFRKAHRLTMSMDA